MIPRLFLPFLAVVTLLGCVCLHEAGHAAAACLTGGRISEFVLFGLPPHVKVGGTGTVLQEEFRAAAGSGGFLLFYLAVAILGRPRSAAGRLAKDIAALFAGVELLGWALSAAAGVNATGPNDAARFLELSGASPEQVGTVCLLIACICAAATVAGERRGRAGGHAAAANRALAKAAGTGS